MVLGLAAAPACVTVPIAVASTASCRAATSACIFQNHRSGRSILRLQVRAVADDDEDDEGWKAEFDEVGDNQEHEQWGSFGDGEEDSGRHELPEDVSDEDDDAIMDEDDDEEEENYGDDAEDADGHGEQENEMSVDEIEAEGGDLEESLEDMLAEVEEDEENRKQPRRSPKHLLKPPWSKNAEKLLLSPQLRQKTLPLLGSLLPPRDLTEADRAWAEEHLGDVKYALGLEPSETCAAEGKDSSDFWQYDSPDPKAHLNTLLYIALRSVSKPWFLRTAHSRLRFLGEQVLKLALAEMFLQLYPRDVPAKLKERVIGMTSPSRIREAINSSGLHYAIFPQRRDFTDVRPNTTGIVLALIGALYLSCGMTEVHKLLFETLGFDPLAEKAHPLRDRLSLKDVDHVSADFENQLSWKDVAFYKRPLDAIFAHPRLYRACVPPGIYRFRRNMWDIVSRPQVMRRLRYPLHVDKEDPEVTKLRNTELGLALQLCFLHPSKYKSTHPRFCLERLEYIGRIVQQLVLAEKILMRDLDAPYPYLREKVTAYGMRRVSGKRLQKKRLARYIQYGNPQVTDPVRIIRLKLISRAHTTFAIHGLGYLVYGLSEVRRLAFDIFEFGTSFPDSRQLVVSPEAGRFLHALPEGPPGSALPTFPVPSRYVFKDARNRKQE